MKIGELVALLTVDDSEFRTKTDQAKQRFSSVGDKVSDVGKTMSTRVTAPLAGLAGLAIKTGMDFQTSMLKVQAVSGATGDELDQLTALAREMGSTTQFSASEAADALGFLGMAGFKTEEMLSSLPGVLNLAAAGQLDLASAADIASNILSGYALEVEELARVNDVLAKAASSSNVDVAMLGETFKYAGPVAAAAGVEFEEAAAMAGLMGNAGIQASQAGTALRGGLSRLLSPTKQVSETLERLGVNVTDAKGELLPMVDIIRQLEKAGADTADMMTIFGVEAGPAFMAVMSQGSDELSKFTDELRNSGGTAQEMADIMQSGAQGGVNAMKSAFEGLMISIADSGLLDAVAWLTRLVGDLLGKASGLPAPVLRTAVVVGALVAAIGPALFIGGKFIAMYGTAFTTALKLARLAMVVFRGQWLITTAVYVAGWVRVVAVTVAQGAVMVARMVATAAIMVAQWAIMAAGAMARAAVMAASWIVAMGPVGWVIAAVVGLVALIIANWDTVKNWTVNTWNAVVGFVTEAAGWVRDRVVAGVTAARDGVVNTFNAVIGFVRGIPGRVLSALGNLGGLLLGAGRALVDGFLRGIQAAWDRVVGFVRKGMQWLRDLWPFSPAKEGPFSGRGYVTHSGRALTYDFAESLRAGMPTVVDAARDMMGAANVALSPPLDDRPTGLPGHGWLSRAPGTSAPSPAAGPSPREVADAVSAGVSRALDGARMQVDGRGIARLTNRANLRDARRGGHGFAPALR